MLSRGARTGKHEFGNLVISVCVCVCVCKTRGICLLHSHSLFHLSYVSLFYSARVFFFMFVVYFIKRDYFEFLLFFEAIYIHVHKRA